MIQAGVSNKAQNYPEMDPPGPSVLWQCET
jgi:hypothetical protein